MDVLERRDLMSAPSPHHHHHRHHRPGRHHPAESRPLVAGPRRAVARPADVTTTGNAPNVDLYDTPSIGGGFTVTANAPGGLSLASCSIGVSGPGPVISGAGQSWGPRSSNYATTSGASDSWTGAPGDAMPPSYSFSGYWGAQDGTYTITASCTYSDGSAGTSTQTVDVARPDVAWIEVTGEKLQGGPVPDEPGNVGVWHQDRPGAVMMEAWVNSVPTDGTLGFVQLVSGVDDIANGTLDTYQITWPAGSTALDSAGGNPYFAAYSVPVSAGQQQVDVGAIGDSPRFRGPVNIGDGNEWTAFRQSASFRTYLDWCPSGGIHVAIAEVDWTDNGAASLQQDGTWVMTQNDHPADGWVSTGGPTDRILTWTDNAQDVSGASITAAGPAAGTYADPADEASSRPRHARGHRSCGP